MAGPSGGGLPDSDVQEATTRLLAQIQMDAARRSRRRGDDVMRERFSELSAPFTRFSDTTSGLGKRGPI
jgi:hypothetical protein